MVRGGVAWVIGATWLAALATSGCYGSNGDDATAGAEAADSGTGSGASGSGASGTGTAGTGTAGSGGAGTIAGTGGRGVDSGVPRAGSAGDPSTAGTAGPGETPQPSPFVGEPCQMGEAMECVCVNGGLGTKVCRYDASSPTSGSFGPCDSCSEPVFDAGLGSLCLGHTLSFGSVGGFVASEDRHQLGPCNEFSTTRTALGAGSSGACENLVYDSADVSVATVLDALGWREVVDAFTVAPVFYGVDGRAFDAPVFHMELDGAVVEIGLECTPNDATACTPIPASLSELRELLLQLVEQQHRLPDCTLLP